MADLTASPIKPLDTSLRHTKTKVRRVVFGLLAAFILLGPAPGQLFGKHSPWLREWVMYSGVGVGILDGSFTASQEDGTQTVYSPLQVAGLDSYPMIKHYYFDNRVFVPEDLGKFAANLCETLEPGGQLAFDGYVGTRQGWQVLKQDNVCRGVHAK